MLCQYSTWYVFCDIYDYSTPATVSIQSITFRIPFNIELRNSKCVSNFVSVIIKISSLPITSPYRSTILFRKELVSRLFIMTLFIFSILFFKDTKAAFRFKEILVRPKNRFLGAFAA